MMTSTLRRTAVRSVLALGIGILALAGVPSAARAQGPAPAPAASLDAILKEVATYDGGIDSAALWKLRDYVYARKDDATGRAECEAKLLQFLKTPATPVARMAACRYLRLIAGDTAIPALQAMLTDRRSADLALYALQGIPGRAAEQALVQSVSTTTGATKIAVIATLGERRAMTAVPALVPLLQQPALAAAAATALGRIGGEAATTALVKAFGAAPAELMPVLAGAILEDADRLVAAKNVEAARALYATVLPLDGSGRPPTGSAQALPASMRRAAAMGHIVTAGTGATALVLKLLGDADPVLQEAAIARMAGAVGPDAVDRVLPLMAGLSEPLRVRLLTVLAGYPGDHALSPLLLGVKSDSEMVRLAALKLIGPAGDTRCVRLLAEIAANTRGPEQAAARAALGALRGRAIDAEILAQLGGAPPDAVAGELLLAIGDRRVYSAKPAVAASLTSRSPVIRMQAYRALRTIGTPSDVPAVLDALLAASDEGEQAEAEKTAAALGQKITNADGRSRTIRFRLGAAKTPDARVRLIGLLGIMGDPAALPVLRSALRDREPAVVDAAVRALAGWPSSAAREDLLVLARDSRNETHRLLSIQGLIRTIGLDAYRDPEAAVADLRLAAGFAWRADEQKLVLGVLSQFPCADALDLATGFLQEPLVKAEAQAAIDRIVSRLPKEAIRK